MIRSAFTGWAPHDYSDSTKVNCRNKKPTIMKSFSNCRLGQSQKPRPIMRSCAPAWPEDPARLRSRLGRTNVGRILVSLTLIGLSGAFLSAPGALGQSSLPTVWVLHDEDPDYVSPTIGDTLDALSDSGQSIASTAGINICQTVGAWRA